MKMEDKFKDNLASEPAAELTYYTIEELTARIDEAEEEIDRGEGKTFEEMMNGFKQQLL